MLATAPHGTRLFPQPTYANRGYRYWRQTREGHILVGGWRDLASEEEVGEEEHTTTRIQAALDTFLAEHRVDAPVSHRWAGIMGFSHDALPYVGRTAAGPYICAGFTGHGNGFAVEAAALLSVLLRGDVHPDADLFDPDRA
jgi:gamma-glutamylputrescine oxidase